MGSELLLVRSRMSLKSAWSFRECGSIDGEKAQNGEWSSAKLVFNWQEQLHFCLITFRLAREKDRL